MISKIQYYHNPTDQLIAPNVTQVEDKPLIK